MRRVIAAALMNLLFVCGSLLSAADTIPVRVLLGKRELVASSVYDGGRILAPLEILQPLGATYTALSDDGALRVISATGESGDVQTAEVKGGRMIVLDDLVKLTGGELAFDLQSRTAQLITHLKSVEFANNLLKINCSFPVTYSTHRWENKIVVDVADAKLVSEAKEVYIGTDLVARARLGQRDDGGTRVVLDLVKNAGYRLVSDQPAAQILLAVDESISNTPKPASVAKVQQDQPYTISGIRLETANENGFDVIVETSDKASVTSSYSVNPPEIVLKFERATLSESMPEFEGSHPLLSSLKFEQVSRNPACVRVSLSLARIMAYDVRLENQSAVISVRLPSKAGGTLAEKFVVIDPGHGGREKGAQFGNVYEKDVNMRLARELAAVLEREGVRVRLTRDGDQAVGLTARPEVAINSGADFFISLHCNSNGKPESASGIETYYHMYEPSPRALAFAIHEGGCVYTGMCDRRARSDRSLYSSGLAVLRRLAGTGLPGVLVECGYLNHSSDRARLLNAQYRRKLAEGIVAGLKAYVEGTPIK
jgi:N-acetylmuramoyl-L-alanine amidase